VPTDVRIDAFLNGKQVPLVDPNTGRRVTEFTDSIVPGQGTGAVAGIGVPVPGVGAAKHRTR